MSVCLTVTKSIATISAGLNSGLCFGGTVFSSPAAAGELKTASGSGAGSASELVIGALSTISAVFYGASYIGAPARWKHPYLLYTGALSFAMAGITLAKVVCAYWCARGRGGGRGGACARDRTVRGAETTPARAEHEDHSDSNGQDESMVLVSETSNQSISNSVDSIPASKAGNGCQPENCCSDLYSLLDTLRAIASIGVVALGVVGGLGEPLALL